MAKQTKQDQIYFEAVERFRKACNWKRTDLIRTLAELAEQICDDDKAIILSKLKRKSS